MIGERHTSLPVLTVQRGNLHIFADLYFGGAEELFYFKLRLLVENIPSLDRYNLSFLDRFYGK